MTIGGALDMAALAKLHFHVLAPDQQEQAIRRMAVSGYGQQTIAHATGLSVEQVQRVLGGRDTAV